MDSTTTSSVLANLELLRASHSKSFKSLHPDTDIIDWKCFYDNGLEYLESSARNLQYCNPSLGIYRSILDTMRNDFVDDGIIQTSTNCCRYVDHHVIQLIPEVALLLTNYDH